MKKATFFVLLIFLMACGGSASFKKVEIPGKYSIEVPQSLTVALNLHKEASLQYENKLEELYVIVIDETKDEFIRAVTDNQLSDMYPPDLNGYTKLITEGFKESLEDCSLSAISDKVINGLKSKSFTVTGTLDDEKVYYSMTCFEGKEHFYQMMIWTYASKQDFTRAKFDHMINSFKEK